LTLPERMRVARLYAWGDVRVEDAPVPRPGAGEVVIRVSACGLCGSDALEWYVAKKAPTVLGHEPVGTVAAVGAGVEHLAVGQRVFVHHHAPCMQCAECARRLWSSCAVWRQNQLDPGGFAEYALVKAGSVARDVLPLPASLSDEVATFIEPVACCLRALDKARTGQDDTVLLIGLGAMGLLLGQLATLRGVRAVLGSDPREDRRELAAALGITALPAGSELRATLGGHTADRGADAVIVTPGSAAAIQAGIDAAAPGGRVVCFTPLAPAEPVTLDQTSLYFREIELLQSYSCGPDETRAALELLSGRGIRTAPLVTHRVGLDGVGAALERAHRAEGIKSIVMP
jgi:L-iditol 2-dehydrogenase